MQDKDEADVQDKDENEVKDKDEAEVLGSEEDDVEFVDSDYEFSKEEFGFKTIEVLVQEGAKRTMNGNNEGPIVESPGEVSSDGEHTSDFDTQSESDGDDMEGDNEGTSKGKRKQNCLGLSSIGGR